MVLCTCTYHLWYTTIHPTTVCVWLAIMLCSCIDRKLSLLQGKPSGAECPQLLAREPGALGLQSSLEPKGEAVAVVVGMVVVVAVAGGWALQQLLPRRRPVCAGARSAGSRMRQRGH